jgi:hypothetical protein
LCPCPHFAGQLTSVLYAVVLFGLIGEVLFSLLFAFELCINFSLLSFSFHGCAP